MSWDTPPVRGALVRELHGDLVVAANQALERMVTRDIGLYPISEGVFVPLQDLLERFVYAELWPEGPR